MDRLQPLESVTDQPPPAQYPHRFLAVCQAPQTQPFLSVSFKAPDSESCGGLFTAALSTPGDSGASQSLRAWLRGCLGWTRCHRLQLWVSVSLSKSASAHIISGGDNSPPICPVLGRVPSSPSSTHAISRCKECGWRVGSCTGQALLPRLWFTRFEVRPVL